MVKTKSDKIMVAGKRKTAVAKALVGPGDGKVLINDVPYEILPTFKRLRIKEPIEISREVLGDFKFDISIRTIGGGQESQIEAARLAIAKAILKITKSGELKKAFLEYDRNLIVADTRRREAYKPGDSKARRKRQKSYR